MDSRRSLVHSGTYFLLTTVAAVVGLGLAAVGGAVAVMNAGTTTVLDVAVPAPSPASAPGVVLLLVGVLVWRLGKAWAFYATIPAAVEEEVADTFDTEHVKSDIVSVLDDRLADMQRDLQSVNREIRNLKRQDEP